jgi:hypothetical protein
MIPRTLEKHATKLRVRARWLRYAASEWLAGPPSTLTCPICGTDELLTRYPVRATHDRFGGGRLVRFQCPACDVIFGTRRMLSLTAAELAQEYRDVYATYDENDSTQLELKAFSYLQPRPGGRYLNFGAGRWSSALSILRQQGHDVVAYDPYIQMDRGGTVITREEDLRRLRFDGIMSNNLIEHLQDPVAALTQQAALLKDRESCMVHATACYRYEYEWSRLHLFFFVGRSLATLARRAGLRVEETDDPDVRRFTLA